MREPSSYSPDDYRMSLGDHLEELRRRLIFGLIGFAIAVVICLYFGRTVVSVFCAPLLDAQRGYDLNTQVFATDVSGPFVVWIHISIISALVLSSPWLLYQLWLFVAAGLYPSERAIVKRYVPLSIALLVTGFAFVYWLVLPWTLQFFLAFTQSIALPSEYRPTQAVSTQPAVPLLQLPALEEDPANPGEFSMWFNTREGRMKLYHNGDVRLVMLSSPTLVTPLITLGEYIGLVLGMLIVFGVSFQLPLVVVALAKVGIVDVDDLRKYRKYVYFIMVIVAAVITPGDVITATIALLVPLCLLYELGLWLARGPKPETRVRDN